MYLCTSRAQCAGRISVPRLAGKPCGFSFDHCSQALSAEVLLQETLSAMHKSDHLKEQIKLKVQERDRLEGSIQECSARLDASGAGLRSNLVDLQVWLLPRNMLYCVVYKCCYCNGLQGFPRADIDVPAARADRQKIASKPSIIWTRKVPS